MEEKDTNNVSFRDKMLENEEVSASKEKTFEKIINSKEIIFSNPFALLTAIISITLCIFHLFSALNSVIEAYTLRTTHLCLITILCFLIKPLGRKSIYQKANMGTIIDTILIILAIGVQLYVLYDIKSFQGRVGDISQTDIVAGMIVILLTIEAARRIVGNAMVIICGFFLIQTKFSNFFPGFLNGPPSSFKNMVNWLWMVTEGIYSIPIAVMASYIFLFVVFGSLMVKTGAGELFINLALAATGRKKGGPAKAAVIASAIMGTVSGSAAGNVVCTGTFTIPLMKKVGFKPTFAGAVEACASTGGQIMPPVMAATAFIISEMMGVPYIQVVKAATIPSLLYFYSIYKMIDIEAHVKDLKSIDESDMPDIKEELKRGWHLLAVLVILIFMILAGRTPAMAVSYSIIILLIVTNLRKHTRISIVDIINAFEEGAKQAVPVSIACAAAGIIIGCLSVSGLSLRLTSLITTFAGGNVWMLLIFTMIASIILGMGMPTAGVYITLAALVIPSLIKSGIYPMAANFFPFFYGVFSTLTPPVCLSSYAAASIAKSDPMKTAFEAFRLALLAMILPFAFVYNPALLMQGSIVEIIVQVIFAIMAVNALGYAIQGWWNKPMNNIYKIILFALVILLLSHSIVYGLIGTAIYIVLAIKFKRDTKDV